METLGARRTTLSICNFSGLIIWNRIWETQVRLWIQKKEKHRRTNERGKIKFVAKIDLTVGDGGNTMNVGGTTRAATTGTLYISQDSSNLKRKIEKQQERIDFLNERVELLERDLRLAKASKSNNNMNFSKEELAFILSKVHPDKNPNSKIAPALTQKLIKNRQGE